MVEDEMKKKKKISIKSSKPKKKKKKQGKVYTSDIPVAGYPQPSRGAIVIRRLYQGLGSLEKQYLCTIVR